jgi:phosphatidylserine/phosphatidylglycerophosphate/cardiolipin synthase-like enzyme
MRNIFLNTSSSLYDQNTFYRPFERDLVRAKDCVIIESPFVTSKRVSRLLPIIAKLRKRGVKVVINTKPLDEHDTILRDQATYAIADLQEIGVKVLFTSGHHRKLAIIDGSVLYEGSLNILSQNDSCEIMRRIEDEELALQMLRFIGLEKWCK